MTRSPFIVSISDLRRPGDSRRERLVAPVDWQLAMSRLLADPPLEASLTLQAISGGILVRGTVDAMVRHTCHHCLEEFVESEHVEVAAVFFSPSEERQDAEDDGYALEGDELDLEQMVRDEMMLALPMLTRCRADCPGVVTTPETDLNTALPGETEDRFGSPFDALRDLLEPGT